jgi:hypothetical protein
VELNGSDAAAALHESAQYREEGEIDGLRVRVSLSRVART